MDINAVDFTSRVADSVQNTDAVKAERIGASAREGDSEKASKMFEELLATMLVREMRRGLGEGFFGSGAGSDVYEGWLDQHVGRSLAANGSLDLAQSIRISLDQKQELADKNTP